MRGGGGAPEYKQLPQNPFAGYFYDEEICIAFYESYPSTGRKEQYKAPWL